MAVMRGASARTGSGGSRAGRGRGSQVVFEVLVHFEDGRLVAAAVAVVRRREDSDDVALVAPRVPLRAPRQWSVVGRSGKTGAIHGPATGRGGRLSRHREANGTAQTGLYIYMCVYIFTYIYI